MTQIKLLHRKDSGSNDITLYEAEPFYNTHDKKLYIGNQDNETVGLKKHIAEITNTATIKNTNITDAVIEFQIGEATDNVFRYNIGSVIASAHTSELVNTNSTPNQHNQYFLTTATAVSSAFKTDGTAKNATYGLYPNENEEDKRKGTIGDRLNGNDSSISNLWSWLGETGECSDALTNHKNRINTLHTTVHGILGNNYDASAHKVYWAKQADDATNAEKYIYYQVDPSTQQQTRVEANINDAISSEINARVEAVGRLQGQIDGITTGGTETSGNAATATQWKTPRTITFTSDVIGSVKLDGSTDVTCELTVENNSHTHDIGNVNGLETELNEINTALEGKSAIHEHPYLSNNVKYASSSEQGGAAEKVAHKLSIQLNGGTATEFDGSSAETLDITAENIGAAVTGHHHDDYALKSDIPTVPSKSTLVESDTTGYITYEQLMSILEGYQKAETPTT